MSVARFSVFAVLDGAGGKQKGVVTIDRDTGLVTVRPHGKHATYNMPLNQVADFICRSALLTTRRRVDE